MVSVLFYDILNLVKIVETTIFKSPLQDIANLYNHNTNEHRPHDSIINFAECI